MTCLKSLIDVEQIESISTLRNVNFLVKNLGIRIDNRLTFRTQIDRFCRTAAHFNRIMYQARHCFSKNHLIRFCKVYSRSHIEYCLPIYGNTKTLLKRILIMQKRIFCSICFRKKCDKILNIGEENDNLLIQDLFLNKLFQEVSQQIRKKSPLDLKIHNNPYQKTRSSCMRPTEFLFRRTLARQNSMTFLKRFTDVFLKDKSVVYDFFL